jgi:glycosyltransferase involved in cell wall biosynthesis
LTVVFVTRAILQGGIDRQLAALVTGLRSRGHAVAVATFFGGDGGPFDRAIRASAETFDADIRGRWDLLRLTGRTSAWIRARRPQVVYGQNIETNLLALLVGRLPPRRRVVWGIRWENPGVIAVDGRARAAARLHARFGRVADMVIANSHAGGNYAREIGVTDERLRVIVNGVDSHEFAPDTAARSRLRHEWRVADDETLIGTVGLDPLKRHAAFLRAASVFVENNPRARFVLVGPAELAYRRRLELLGTELGLNGKVIWAGPREDMRAVYNALDLATLLSRSEGTPNSIAEAMACGVPCVASNAGDSAAVVGDGALIVESVSPHRVAATWSEALARPWTAADRAGLRLRIRTAFGLERMISEQERTLRSLV